ncbi:MAG: zf-HC2 domain-containing protein [Anaerolineae bacterium]|nr:zf-HC2 domain-containing protein [Anaerolineae bacterium]MDW8098210.1 zf-HC2 domain-containing protein [Anaerolineae bacterium]
MKVRKIPVTPEKVDELMALFRGLPAQPVGEHLTDGEFIAYVMGTLSADEVARLDIHLDSCLACAAEVERLQEVAAF